MEARAPTSVCLAFYVNVSKVKFSSAVSYFIGNYGRPSLYSQPIVLVAVMQYLSFWQTLVAL